MLASMFKPSTTTATGGTIAVQAPGWCVERASYRNQDHRRALSK
jgi:hypothetical protein